MEVRSFDYIQNFVETARFMSDFNPDGAVHVEFGTKFNKQEVDKRIT